MIDDLSSAPRAFISYARADAEAFATALRRRLEHEHPEIALWQDRARMEGGIGWWKQITDALNQVQILIMVMSPAVVTSATARKEWRYARQQGARICPVLIAADFDFAALPSWMRRVHCYNLDHEWDAFVGFLGRADKDSRVPFMAPDLREGYVPRPREYRTLTASLLTGEPLEPVAATTALQGSGGFGKSTLATALCHDDDVINAFDDGILWTTLGQKPNLQVELTRLYAALTGDRPPFLDAEDAAISLATRLEDKHCLIVIDDAWNVHDVEPFLRSGRHCARLITTRQLRVVTESNAAAVLVDEMTESESVQMLIGAFSATPANLDPLRALADRLGDWPLLLALAAAQLRARMQQGDSPEGALSFVNRGLDKRGAVAFDRASSAARHDAVATTVGASLDLLKEVDRRRCIELSILAEDRGVPIGVVRLLWGTDNFDTEALLQELDAASLVEFDMKTASMRMHAKLRAFLESLLENAPAVHRRLIQTGWTDPYALPDTYAWRWYAWHVDKGGGAETLRRLLFDIDWMQAKHRATGIDGLVQDYEFLGAEPAARLVQDALRLAAPALSRFPAQLATQLAARLRSGHSALIDALLAKAISRVPRPWLRLLHRSLTLPGGPLVSIIKGHTEAVEALALSTDGRWIVSAARDGTVRLWDLESGHLERSFDHGAPVTCIACSHDGHRIATGSEDHVVRAWNLDTGVTEGEHRHHSGPIRAIAIASGGLIYSLSDDGTIRAWNVETRLIKTVLRWPSHGMYALAMAPGGTHAVCGTGDTRFAMLDLARPAVVNLFDGHSDMVRTLAVSPDGRWVASGSDDRTMRIWQRDTARTIRVLDGHSDTILSLAFTVDGRRLISGAADMSIRVWDVASGQLLRTLEGHSGPVPALAIHPDGRRVISASADRTLRVWDVGIATVAQPTPVHQTAVTILAISGDGRSAVSGSPGSTALRVWDVGADRVLRTLDGAGGHVAAIAISSDGSRLLVASGDNALRLWELPSGDPIHRLKGHTSNIFKVAMTPDGNCGISLSRDGTMRVWDLQFRRAPSPGRQGDHPVRSSARPEPENGGVRETLRVPLAHGALAALSADGSRLLCASASTLTVWDVEAGTPRTIPLPDFEPVCLATARDGRSAVALSRLGSAAICDLGDASVEQVDCGHAGVVCDARITDEGRVVTVSQAGLRAWSLGGQSGSRAFDDGPWNEAAAIRLSPSGATVFCIAGDTVSAASVASGAVLGSLTIDHEITSMAVAANEPVLAVGDESGRVHFARLEDG